MERNPLPAEFLGCIEQKKSLCVIEEHVAQGSAGQMISHALMSMGLHLRSFTHLCAKGYPTGLYGSQAFHRKESGLDPENVRKQIVRMSNLANSNREL